MSKFEEYQEKKKQNQNMYEFYRSRRDEALDTDRMPYSLKAGSVSRLSL